MLAPTVRPARIQMQIVPSTALAFLMLLMLAIKGPYRGLWVFLAATPFGAAAAFNLPAAGGASILVSDLGALMLFALLWVQPDAPNRLVGTMRAYQPGFWMLLLVVVCVVSALFYPRLFQGATSVFGLSRVNNATGIVEVPLHATNGNLTQLFRIMLDAAAFFALATVFRLRPDGDRVLTAIAVATFVNVGLGWLDVLTAAAGQPKALDVIRTANYAILAGDKMVGIKRMVGGFPEASAFGYYTLGLFGFWLHMWLVQGRSRRTGWALFLTTVALLRSTSSSAYVSAVVFLVGYAAVRIASGGGRTVSRRAVGVSVAAVGAVLMAGVALAVCYAVLPPVTAFLDRALFDKMGTSSGVERMSWNTQAWANFIDTWGVGAGLGSMRASNWVLASLGSIGFIGTSIFLALVAAMAWLPARAETDAGRAAVIGALKSGCLALFVSAMLTAPTPDLGMLFFAMAGLATGLSRGAARESSKAEMWRRVAD
ncbi:hypothetical protein [Acidimangrovimonas sediminis]|uniref:hypothetical protein n=1 Tax=Acidimangrovimonas sediminis TaxID=2056283 RepID=UPI0011AF1F83|nr:hypothetical protein [Acidimangrovimonas sediminis]